MGLLTQFSMETVHFKTVLKQGDKRAVLAIFSNLHLLRTKIHEGAAKVIALRTAHCTLYCVLHSACCMSIFSAACVNLAQMLAL